MVIEEFISTYADQELNKINKINSKNQQQQQQLASESEEDIDSLDLTPASRGGSRRAVSGRGVNPKSPRSGMPTEKTYQATVDHGVSGTSRQKKITQRDIERIQANPRAGRVLEQNQ